MSVFREKQWGGQDGVQSKRDIRQDGGGGAPREDAAAPWTVNGLSLFLIATSALEVSRRHPDQSHTALCLRWYLKNKLFLYHIFLVLNWSAGLNSCW